MISQVTFRAEKDIKQKAIIKAKKDGITLRAILNSCLRAYANNKIELDLSAVVTKPKALIMDPKDMAVYQKRRADYDIGKNTISFEAMMADLRNKHPKHS